MKKLLSFFFGSLGRGKTQTINASKNWSKRRHALHALKSIEPFLDKRFNPMLSSAVKLEVIAPDIIKFQAVIKKLGDLVKSSEVIKASDCFFSVTEKTLDKFFTDEDSYYISQTELTSFYKEATRLCELTEQGETAEFGIDEHNLRILSKVFTGIKNVCVAVVEVNTVR